MMDNMDKKDNKDSKDKSIEYILAQGFVEPPTFWGRVSKMFRVIGWKFIFWDLNYSLIFASVTILGIMFLFRYVPELQYSIAFALSPIMFLIIVLFAEISERMCDLYELKQTCRYTSRQIAAPRCVCYSVVGVVFAVGVTAFSAENIAQFFRLLPLCLGGLFLFAAIELLVIRFSRNKWAIAIFSSAWILLNLALPAIFRGYWEAFLSNLPIVLTIVLAIMGALAFAYQTNKMLMEENYYVIA